MKNFKIFNLFAMVALVAAFALSASAQTFTTVSIAQTATGRTLCLASATGVALPGNLTAGVSDIGSPTGSSGTVLFVDSEAEFVSSAGSSSTCFVTRRGFAGSKAAAHIVGAKVWVGTMAQFSLANPYDPTKGATAFEAQGIGAALASASTITVTNPIHHVTGTSAIQTINFPAFMSITGGCVVLVPDAAYTIGTSGNLGKASTATAFQNMMVCYDPVAGKGYASY